MGLAHESDEVLLADAGRDPEAFGRFYRRHAAAVLAYLAYRARNADDAVELTAETFAAAFEASGRYRPGPVPARGWLFGIANHKLVDLRRRARREERALRRLGIDRIAIDDEQLERVEQLVDAQRAGPALELYVEGLPPRQREAVLARILEGRDYAEIAVASGSSHVAARKLVSRGLARLAGRLREDE
jgi:RNA polymerase sigma factor (sigma-70 family)